MRHVSGSAVQGPGGAVLWPDRFPGALGFNLLIQLILDPARDQLTITRTQPREFQEKRSEGARKYNDRGIKNKRMLWERSGGEEEVRVVWKERNRRREVSCRGTITVGRWKSLQQKVHCCFRNGVILSSLQTLSSSLKPTPLHSQSGWARCTVVRTKKAKHLRRWLDQASFRSSLLNVGHKSQRLKQSRGKENKNCLLECLNGIWTVNHTEFVFFFLLQPPEMWMFLY